MCHSKHLAAIEHRSIHASEVLLKGGRNNLEHTLLHLLVWSFKASLVFLGRLLASTTRCRGDSDDSSCRCPTLGNK